MKKIALFCMENGMSQRKKTLCTFNYDWKLTIYITHTQQQLRFLYMISVWPWHFGLFHKYIRNLTFLSNLPRLGYLRACDWFTVTVCSWWISRWKSKKYIFFEQKPESFENMHFCWFLMNFDVFFTEIQKKKIILRKMTFHPCKNSINNWIWNVWFIFYQTMNSVWKKRVYNHILYVWTSCVCTSCVCVQHI